jgi:TRAP-type C4-dicarboxylate transport system permease small subunit
MEGLRDLAIIILSFTATVVLIFMGVLAWCTYQQVKSASDSLRETSKTIHDAIQKAGGDALSPVFQIISLVQGVRQGVEEVMKLFRRRREVKGESK